MNETGRIFRHATLFRQWLGKNHGSHSELWVRFYNRQSNKTGMSYKEAVDEALCFGWIDGIRKNVDEESYTIRFTPRKKNSIWSNVNTSRMKELISEKRVHEAGLAAYGRREEKKAGIYSFEQPPASLGDAFEKKFRANRKAWSFFTAQAPWYQRTAMHLVMSARQEATRIKRLEVLIACSSRAETIPQLTRKPSPKTGKKKS